MSIEVWQRDSQKKQNATWAFRVIDKGKVIFQSREVSVRFLSDEAASWVATIVEALQGPGRQLEWHGDLGDDCSTDWKGFVAHAEHLNGPRRGGSWYCSVSGTDGMRFFHTADKAEIQPKSGAAARWLCELVISAVEAGIVEPYPA